MEVIGRQILARSIEEGMEHLSSVHYTPSPVQGSFYTCYLVYHP